ncbi:hypothetical protein BESB_059410 [Besnoitia besnoiti]|uniref:Uncharacterized protein n=1 Tax=Besnoitia besnoiti TaxID=94643 RepID=A0A2A9MCW2_BESBE|nr:hypothetical protein BESB_059410 [Besnoitia besnoiti]PFH35054.1 hypothetical protein BESB_059410 [Besnoitia besnoiti]
MTSRRVGGLGRRCFLTLHCSACSFFLQTSDAVKLLLTQQPHILRRIGAAPAELEQVQGPKADEGKPKGPAAAAASSARSDEAAKGKRRTFFSPSAASPSPKFPLLPLADAALLLKRRGDLVLRSLHGDPLVGSRRQRGEFAPQAPTAEMTKMLNKSGVFCPNCKREGRWEEGRK